MKYLKIKDIVLKEDTRMSNIVQMDSTGVPIKFKQSKCTCRFVLIDDTGEEFCWVANNESLAKALCLIAENEDKKYNAKNNPKVLGRNLLLLSWIQDIWNEYLTKHGFNPPLEDLEKAKRFKHGTKN